MPEEYIQINKLTRLQLAELDTCSRCAQCADYCPTYIETEGDQADLIPGKKAGQLSRLVGKQKGVWALLRRSKPVKTEEIEEMAKALYTCTLCGRCQVVCPFSIKTEDLWRTFRSILYDANYHPEPLKLLDGGIEEKGNPYGAGGDLRTMWMDYVDSSEVPLKETAEVVYFVGCTSALKAQVQDIPYATAVILNSAGEDWTLLGEKERCCGSPSLMIGNLEMARELARHNTELIESTGARRVVTSCPGCYRALKKYPHLLGRKLGFDVFHTVELLHQYLKEGRLKITEKFKERIAFHDPCELGRLSSIIEEPRAILRAATDDTVELPENGIDSRCCGGGGLLLAVDAELRLKIAEHRIRQAEEVKADILVSACPACKMSLLDGIRSLNTEMKMVDITELVAQKLGR